LAAYPHEDTGRLVRGYLAWILIQKHQLPEAAQITDDLSRSPPGAARDLASLLEAVLLLQHDNPLEALRVLRPLQGKLIDPVERFLATEQLVYAALGATLYSEAIASMAEWIAQAGVLQREAVKAAALTRLRRIPRRYLERALDSRPARTSEKDSALGLGVQQKWVYENISRILVDLAVAERDTDLARRILAHNPTALGLGETTTELVRLAANDQSAASIVGRSFGLILSTDDPEARRRSIEAAEAISVVLGLAQDQAAGEPIQMLVSEPSQSFEEAMSDLARQGAGLLIAGVTEHDANLAASYSERARMPVLLLTPPVFHSPYAFSIGVSREAERLALSQLLDPKDSLQVIDDEQCRVAAAAEADSRFPISSWEAQGVSALLLLTDPECTRSLLNQLKRTQFQPTCLFGLSASPTLEMRTAYTKGRLRAHRFPMQRGDTPEVDDFIRQLGHAPSWFGTLGHDAAVIARATISAVYSHDTSELRDVERVHEQMRAQLKALHQTGLWSSAEGRFDEQRNLTRQLQVENQTGGALRARPPN